MSAIDRIVTDNAARPESVGEPMAAPPGSKLAVVTCMDARLDPFDALGLGVGDAHIIRNAGGIVTDDVLRSLAISQRALGTREVALIHHTRCGMEGFDDATFRADLATETGEEPGWRGDGFADVAEDVRASVAAVRACPWLPHRDAVRGFVWDVATDRITEIAAD